eukprot:scaffold321605_cov96-Cyclotella_meneghiniana.AAC.4
MAIGIDLRTSLAAKSLGLTPRPQSFVIREQNIIFGDDVNWSSSLQCPSYYSSSSNKTKHST